MLCVASHYHEIPDIISDQREFIIEEKRDWTSRGIPELIIYREIDEALTQIIAVHSLFKSFQTLRLMILPLCYLVGDMESSGGSCKQRRAI